jgi:hypothetical protein
MQPVEQRQGAVTLPFILKLLLALNESYIIPSNALHSLIHALRVSMDPSLHGPLTVWEWLFNGNTKGPIPLLTLHPPCVSPASSSY